MAGIVAVAVNQILALAGSAGLNMVLNRNQTVQSVHLICFFIQETGLLC